MLSSFDFCVESSLIEHFLTGALNIPFRKDEGDVYFDIFLGRSFRELDFLLPRSRFG